MHPHALLSRLHLLLRNLSFFSLAEQSYKTGLVLRGENRLNRSMKRKFTSWVLAGVAACGISALTASALAATSGTKDSLPNIVLIFLDDGGYADFHPFGNPPYPTPNVARLAQEGTCFTHLYVPQAVCSASRAALLSGCFPGRTRVFGAHPPRARGLDPKYRTIGQILKQRGYRTAVYGKWHIGDQPDTRPPARGFDEWCGLMYSNDMWNYRSKRWKWPLHFWDNGRVVIDNLTPDDQKMLTRWYTEHAVQFIHRWAGKKPFFLYVPHTMPHVPIYCSDRFRGISGVGLYGDVMMELDWSVGEIMRALRETKVLDNTIVIWICSDNGPWLVYGNHAGKTPFREGKGTSFDGGVRNACIIRYPKAFQPGAWSDRAFSTLDLLPTLAHLVGAPLPKDYPIDGRDVWNWITGKPKAQNPHTYYPLSTGRRFEAVLSGDGRWKLHLPHPYRHLATPGKDGKPGKYVTRRIDWTLYDLKNDPLETTDVKDRYPAVYERLRTIALEHLHRFYPNQKIQTQ